MSAPPCFSTFPLSVTALTPHPEITLMALWQKSGACRTGFPFPTCSSFLWYIPMGLFQMQSARNYYPIPFTATLPGLNPSWLAALMDSKTEELHGTSTNRKRGIYPAWRECRNYRYGFLALGVFRFDRQYSARGNGRVPRPFITKSNYPPPIRKCEKTGSHLT